MKLSEELRDLAGNLDSLEYASLLDLFADCAERMEEDRERYEIIKVEKSTIPQGAVLIEAYETDKEYLIVGQPKNEEGLPEEGRHNCDEMGCGCCHIIRRFSKE